MKKILIITSFLFVFTKLNAQNNDEPKFRTYFDSGFFQSSFAGASDGGNYLSAGFGYKINNEFWLNLTLIKISASGSFGPIRLFINSETDYNSTLIIPNFSKDWKLINKFSISGVVGGALIFENALRPSIITDSSNRITGIELSNQGQPFNLGLFGEIIIKYEIINNLYLSINTKSFIPMYLEPESLLFGAGIEIKL